MDIYRSTGQYVYVKNHYLMHVEQQLCVEGRVSRCVLLILQYHS